MSIQPEIKITEDGSHTLFHKEFNETYHSHFGAIQEAYHVFIKSGFDLLKSKNEISILEIGFGTGLNAFITFLEAQDSGQSIKYVGLEMFPLERSIWEKLNFADQLKVNSEAFLKLHEVPWEIENEISNNFILTKIEKDLEAFIPSNKVDLIYFDAFGPNTQPELWTTTIFKNLYQALNPNGILVTYSCKGDVKRAMKAAGYTIEKIPGPPGKREMLRAFKTN